VRQENRVLIVLGYTRVEFNLKLNFRVTSYNLLIRAYLSNFFILINIRTILRQVSPPLSPTQCFNKLYCCIVYIVYRNTYKTVTFRINDVAIKITGNHLPTMLYVYHCDLQKRCTHRKLYGNGKDVARRQFIKKPCSYIHSDIYIVSIGVQLNANKIQLKS